MYFTSRGRPRPEIRLTMPSALLRALVDVDDHQVPGPSRAVIAGQNAEQLAALARQRARGVEAVGEPGIGTVEGSLTGAVGIHHHQRPQEDAIDARVVPAVVDHLPVVEHGRVHVVILVEGDTAHVRAVGVHDEQVGDVFSGRAVPAGNALTRGVRTRRGCDRRAGNRHQSSRRRAESGVTRRMPDPSSLISHRLHWVLSALEKRIRSASQ